MKMPILVEALDISAANAPTNGMLLRSKMHYLSMPPAENRNRQALSKSRSTTQRSKVRFARTAYLSDLWKNHVRHRVERLKLGLIIEI